MIHDFLFCENYVRIIPGFFSLVFVLVHIKSKKAYRAEKIVCEDVSVPMQSCLAAYLKCKRTILVK